MARPCTLCSHPDRQALETALTGGMPYRRVAAHFGVSEQSVRRHVGNCIPASVEAAKGAREAAAIKAGTSTVERLEDALRQTLGIVEAGQKAGDLRLSLAGLAEVRKHLELSAKLLGELRSGDVSVDIGVNVLATSNEWFALRSKIIAALGPFPDARAAVVEALR